MQEEPFYYWEQTLRNAGLLTGNSAYDACLDLWRTGYIPKMYGLAQNILICFPDSVFAQTFFGIASKYMNKVDEALENFEKALSFDDKNAVGHYFAGCILSSEGSNSNTQTAKLHHEAAFKIFPDWVDNLVELAKCCYVTGTVEAAVPHLKTAIEIDPSNARAHSQLVEVLAWLGKHDELKNHTIYLGQLPPDMKLDLREISKTGRGQKHKVKFARYPDKQAIEEDFLRTIKETVLSDIMDSVPCITPETKFFTLGSCFANNLANALKEENYSAFNLNIGETINSTYANKCIFQWLNGDLSPELEERLEHLISSTATKGSLVSELRQADILIYTLGAAACFFERETGHFVLPRPTQINARALAAKYVYRTTSVRENVSNMKAIFDEVRALNPEIKIFLSVSPVPLQATFERNASVVADCISKSVLRVAVEEILALGYENLYYWPSFEIVRWLGAHTGPVFGVDDDSSFHVSEKLIGQIVRLFIETFQGENKVPKTSVIAT